MIVNILQIIGCVGFILVYGNQFCLASALIRQKTIQMKPERSNYEIVQNAVFTRQIAQSLVLCSKLCADHPDCVSFSYDKTSGLCTGGKELNPPLGSLDVSTGFMFYSLMPGTCSRSDYTYLAELRSCIKFYQVYATQSIALSQCIIDGGNLIRITSALKHNVIANEFNIRSGTLGDNLWIDGTDVLVEGQWRFSDGSLLLYTNFEPLDPMLINENCLVMYKPYGFKWADNLCTRNRTFVCEIQTY